MYLYVRTDTMLLYFWMFIVSASSAPQLWKGSFELQPQQNSIFVLFSPSIPTNKIKYLVE